MTKVQALIAAVAVVLALTGCDNRTESYYKREDMSTTRMEKCLEAGGSYSDNGDLKWSCIMPGTSP